jgi:hypothetical protein
VRRCSFALGADPPNVKGSRQRARPYRSSLDETIPLLSKRALRARLREGRGSRRRSLKRSLSGRASASSIAGAEEADPSRREPKGSPLLLWPGCGLLVIIARGSRGDVHRRFVAACRGRGRRPTRNDCALPPVNRPQGRPPPDRPRFSLRALSRELSSQSPRFPRPGDELASPGGLPDRDRIWRAPGYQVLTVFFHPSPP